MRKTIVLATGLLVVAASPAAARDDFLSRYERETGRAVSGAPPAESAAPADPLPRGPSVTLQSLDAFRAAIDRAFPMTPEMIARYREIEEESRRAMTQRAEPEAETVSGLVSLDPGEPPPLLRVSPSIASVIGFHDASGAPWPIRQVVVGAATDFEVVQLGGEESNSLAVSPRVRMGFTNLVVMLEGEDKPVSVRVRVDETAVHFRQDVQVMRLGPRAAPSTATAVEAAPAEAGGRELLAVLSGVDLPERAVELSVLGVQARAWRIGDDLFVRSRHALLSPSWRDAMSGPDGIRAYRLAPAAAALFSVDGRIVRADIQQF